MFECSDMESDMAWGRYGECVDGAFRHFVKYASRGGACHAGLHCAGACWDVCVTYLIALSIAVLTVESAGGALCI